jgi:uncharacterized protein
MNIWLDTTLLSQCLTNGCNSRYSNKGGCTVDGEDTVDPDGTEDCIDSGVPITLVLSEENVRYLYMHTFVCSKTLYIQKYHNSLWLVCNPTGQGRIAVLDAEAYTLLTYFHTPKMLQDAMDGAFDNSSGVARAVALFRNLGFLQDLDQSVSIPDEEQLQTLSAWLHVTNACNLRCHYCYVQKTSEHMTDETTKRAMGAIIRSATQSSYQHIHVTYAGGEATLRLSQVIATHDYALQQTQEHGLSLSAGIVSNGVALPQRLIEQLKQRQIGLMISLDGVGENHDQQRPLLNGQGSFAFVDRTITRLLASDFVPSINITVTPRNLNELPRLLEYILQRDLPFGLSYYRDNECSAHLSNLQFTDAHMISGMRTAFAYIEHHLPRRSLLGSLVDKASMSTLHRYKCGVGRNYLVIDQHGGIAKCQADINRTVTTIDADNPLQMIREDRQGVQAVAIDDKEGCRSCEWRYWCSGGCPLLTYRLTGRSDIKSPNCAIYKALFPEAVRLEALRLLKYEEPITL